MRQAPTLRDRFGLHLDAALLDAHRIRRHAVVFVSRLAGPGLPVKLPVVPGADDEFAVELSLTEWPAHVIALAADGAPLIRHGA